MNSRAFRRVSGMSGSGRACALPDRMGLFGVAAFSEMFVLYGVEAVECHE